MDRAVKNSIRRQNEKRVARQFATGSQGRPQVSRNAASANQSSQRPS